MPLNLTALCLCIVLAVPLHLTALCLCTVLAVSLLTALCPGAVLAISLHLKARCSCSTRPTLLCVGCFGTDPSLFPFFSLLLWAVSGQTLHCAGCSGQILTVFAAFVGCFGTDTAACPRSDRFVSVFSGQTLLVPVLSASCELCRDRHFFLSVVPDQTLLCVGCVRLEPSLCGLCQNRPGFVWAVS